MLSYIKCAAALLAATLPFSLAQTSTDCNPLKKTCPADTGLSSSTFSSDFTKGADDSWNVTAGSITYGSNGAQFTINKQGDAPTIETDFYFFYGTAEIKMQAAPGTGVVSSIVLESDDLDEVDWEALGGDNTQIETNYFGKGNTSSYDRATYVTVSTPQSTFHTYTVNWSSNSIEWLIDGNVVRTLTLADASNGAYFPQTPMRLKLGIWAGGDPTNSAGTIEWAGGKTDYTKAPFTMYVQSVKITNTNPAKQYEYGDTTGSSSSIKLIGGSDTSSSTSVSSSSSTENAGASDTTSSKTSNPTGTSSTFSSVASSNPSSITNPLSGITSSNSTASGSSNSTTSGNSTSGFASSTSAAANSSSIISSNAAVASIGVSGSMLALYAFLFAVVAYVL